MKRFFSTLFLSVALLFSAPLAIAGEDDEYKMTAEEITKIQAILIELGWTYMKDQGDTLFFPTGELDRRTVKAFQSALLFSMWPGTDFLTNDFLTKKQFDFLSSSQGATGFTWGGISAAPDGTYASVSKYSSGVEAYKVAEAGCVKKTSSPCTTITAFVTPTSHDHWISAVLCTGGGESVGISNSWESPSTAEKEAEFEAYRNGFGYSDCKVLITINVNGKGNKTQQPPPHT